METAKHPLTAYRDLTSMSLDAFGKLLGVNKTTVLRWESGNVPIPLKRLSDIEKLTRIPRERLRPDVFAKRETAA